MDNLEMFIPITKVDVEKRLVYGQITAEEPDVAKEVCDYESTKPFYQDWSAEFAKNTDGKSLGNIRAMHGNVAAGKLTSINFDDANKRIECCGKVVDDGEWNKVLEGVYTGFSQGGKYIKRWKDESDPTLTRYTASPTEVSLVDSPCLKSSTFEVVKADGTTEMRKFKSAQDGNPEGGSDGTAAAKPDDPDFTPTTRNPEPGLEQVWKARDGETFTTKGEAKAHNLELDAQGVVCEASAPLSDAVAALKAELDKRTPKAEEKPDGTGKAKPDADGDDLDKKNAKGGEGKTPYGDVEYADPGYQSDKKKRYPLDTAKRIRAAWNYIHKKKNAGKYSADQLKKIKAKIVAAWKAKIDKKGPPEATSKAFIVDGLSKGLYTVSRLATIVEDLKWLQESMESEEMFEGDGSPASDHLASLIGELGAFLVAYATEEVGELSKPDGADYEGDEYEIFELAVGLLPEDVAKVLASVPDHLDGDTKDKLVGFIEKAGMTRSKSDAKRIQRMHDLASQMGAECAGQAAKSETTDDDLAKITAERDAFRKKIEDVVPTITELTERVASLEAQPAPGGPAVRAVTKGQDNAGSGKPEGLGDPVAAFKAHLDTLPADQRALVLMKMSMASPMNHAPEPTGRR